MFFKKKNYVSGSPQRVLIDAIRSHENSADENEASARCYAKRAKEDREKAAALRAALDKIDPEALKEV